MGIKIYKKKQKHKIRNVSYRSEGWEALSNEELRRDAQAFLLLPQESLFCTRVQPWFCLALSQNSSHEIMQRKLLEVRGQGAQ